MCFERRKVEINELSSILLNAKEGENSGEHLLKTQQVFG